MLGQFGILSQVDLSHNDIRAKAAADILKHCWKLTELDVSYNHIRDDGATQVASVLGQCSVLADLNLSANVITEEGAEKIAGVLQICSALAYLRLGFNNLGQPGADKIIAVLGPNCAVRYLDLRDNQIGRNWIHGSVSYINSPLKSQIGWIHFDMPKTDGSEETRLHKVKISY